jgi:hypothetical protein
MVRHKAEADGLCIAALRSFNECPKKIRKFAGGFKDVLAPDTSRDEMMNCSRQMNPWFAGHTFKNADPPKKVPSCRRN